MRELVEPAALLDDWASRHSLKRYEKHRYFVLARDQEELTRQTFEVLDPTGLEYVFTLWSGAAYIAPFRTGPPLVSLLAPNLPTDWESIALNQGFQPAESGHNFEILIVPDRSPVMYAQTSNSLKIASDIQLYLDLWAWPQRGKEQAQHLRKQRIPF